MKLKVFILICFLLCSCSPHYRKYADIEAKYRNGISKEETIKIFGPPDTEYVEAGQGIRLIYLPKQRRLGNTNERDDGFEIILKDNKATHISPILLIQGGK